MIKKIISILCTLLFFWIMYATTIPIIPKGLPEKFSLCHIMGSNWRDIRDQTFPISGNFKSITDLLSNAVTFVYKDSEARHDINCTDKIPDTILYHALSLNINFEINQEGKIWVGIHRFGQSPAWKPIIVKDTDVNKPITYTMLLNNADIPKFNWLSGDYDTVGVTLVRMDPTKNIIFTIHDVYLE